MSSTVVHTHLLPGRQRVYLVGDQITLKAKRLQATNSAGIDSNLHRGNVTPLLLHQYCVRRLAMNVFHCVWHIPLQGDRRNAVLGRHRQPTPHGASRQVAAKLGRRTYIIDRPIHYTLPRHIAFPQGVITAGTITAAIRKRGIKLIAYFTASTITRSRIRSYLLRVAGGRHACRTTLTAITTGASSTCTCACACTCACTCAACRSRSKALSGIEAVTTKE